MPKFKVTRVIHEIMIVEAKDEDEAIRVIGSAKEDELEITCPEIYAEECDVDDGLSPDPNGPAVLPRNHARTG